MDVLATPNRFRLIDRGGVTRLSFDNDQLLFIGRFIPSIVVRWLKSLFLPNLSRGSSRNYHGVFASYYGSGPSAAGHTDRVFHKFDRFEIPINCRGSFYAHASLSNTFYLFFVFLYV